MVIFISCVGPKKCKPCKTKDMYISDYFQTCLTYAQTLTTEDNIFVLSAKYGVLPLEKVIEPYDKTLNKMSKEEKQEWKSMVIGQLNDMGINQDTPVTFICGKNYYSLFEYYFSNIQLPFQQLPFESNIGMGRQKQFMKQQIQKKTHHKLF